MTIQPQSTVITKGEREGNKDIQALNNAAVSGNVARHQQDLNNLDQELSMKASGEQFVEGLLSKFAELGITNPVLIANILTCKEGKDWSRVFNGL